MMTTSGWGRKVACVAALALCASGCASYNTRMSTGLPAGGEVKEQGASFYVYGLVGENNLDLAQVCPGGVSSVQTRMTAGDKFFTFITLGIYSPMTMVVECAGGNAFLLTPDEKMARTEVHPFVG